MRKVYPVLLLLILCVSLQGQELSPEVIVSSGDYLHTPQGSLSFSLGECVTETFTKPSGTLNQGFQQGSYEIISLNLDIQHSIAINVYPNPAEDFLNVVPENLSEDLNIVLLDLSGKILLTESDVTSLTQLDMSNMPPGEYLLQVTSSTNILLESFKIIKH